MYCQNGTHTILVFANGPTTLEEARSKFALIDIEVLSISPAREADRDAFLNRSIDGLRATSSTGIRKVLEDDLDEFQWPYLLVINNLIEVDCS